MTSDGMGVRYRVRHSAAPELFVWVVDVERYPWSPVAGASKKVTVRLTEFREPMRKEDAERLAKLCGGWIEEVVLDA